MKKTKLTRSLLAACSIVALSAVMYGCVHSGDDGEMDAGMEMPMPDPAMPVDVTMPVTLGDEEQELLREVLTNTRYNPITNEYVVVDVDGTVDIPAGGTATRGDVEFTCDSAYPCTVTITNSLGTIIAEVSTQKLPDADNPVVMAVSTLPVDAFARLNPGSTAVIRAFVNDDPDPPEPLEARNAPNWMATELIGMGIGGPGVLDASMAGLRSAFQANGADLTGHATDADTNAATPAIAAPGASPDLRMGTTITGADDGFDASMSDIASAPDGWVMKTLFRDWGDTAGDGDGGFETGAIVVKNLGEGTPYPFGGKLSGKYVNDSAKAMFDLTILASGGVPGVTTLATSVDINMSGTVATATQWEAMVFDSGSLVPAQDQDLVVDAGETFTGTYFGAPGQFQCLGAIDNNSCGLMRNDDGDVVVVDQPFQTDGTANGTGIQNGRWSFTPGDGAMITVPDQDWMAYGAWLTTPDDGTGDHRFGVFFNGFDPYAFEADTLTANDAAGLRGSATYSGGATGIYVDGTDSGLFTARAMLTADFDKASDGVDDEAVDYMISGRIDNFRGTDGEALGADTGDMANPQGRGENDWVVVLEAFDLNTTGDEATAGAIANTDTSGSADGVSWEGKWNGQLFGLSVNADDEPIAPSGVAGQFWANTGSPDDGDMMTLDDNDAVTSVAGAFGATKDE